MNRRKIDSESGFTLVELLTVVALIGILAALGLQAWTIYKASAAYASASVTLRNARTAVDAALSDPDNPPPAVPVGSQGTQGGITGAAARQLLPGMQLSKDIRLHYGYDPTCIDATCPYEAFLQANHCKGDEYTSWIRFGDGVEVLLEHIDGAGCAP